MGKLTPSQLKAIHAKIKNHKGAYEAYDVKARMSAKMKEGTEKTIILKNGRVAVQGISVKSGNKITRIVG
jgi:hypothetical protein